MRPSIIFNVFLRDFRKQRKRIFLTVMALLWGTLSIMLLLAFGEGMRQQFAKNDKGLGEGIVIVWGGQTTKPFQGFGKGRRIKLVPDDIEYLSKKMNDEFEVVSGEYIRWGSEVRYGKKVLNERINGIFPVYESIRNFIPRMGGRMIDNIDIEKKRRVAFLGWNTKERLFGPDVSDEAVVGQLIYVNGTPFTVIGVMAEKMQMSSYQGQDKDVIAIPATTYVAIYGNPYLDNMVLKPRVYGDFKKVEKRLYEVLGARYKFDPTDERALWTWDLVEQRRTTDAIFLGIQIFLGVIGALTLLIAGVGVTNIMYVSIRERTREIGVKMAVGARKSYILVQFVIEALGITFIGGALGMGVAYSATELFKLVPMQDEALQMLGKPTVSFEIGLIVTIILGILGFLSGLFPALRASSINPNDALRYE